MKSQIEIITIYLANLTYKIKPIYQSRIKVKKEIQLVQFMSVVLDWFSFG